MKCTVQKSTMHSSKSWVNEHFSRSIDTWNRLARFDPYFYQSDVFITSKKSRHLDFNLSKSGVSRSGDTCNCTIQFALCKCKRWLECLHWISELSCLLPPVYSQISQETFWRISLEKKNEGLLVLRNTNQAFTSVLLILSQKAAICRSMCFCRKDLQLVRSNRVFR